MRNILNNKWVKTILEWSGVVGLLLWGVIAIMGSNPLAGVTGINFVYALAGISGVLLLIEKLNKR